MTESIQTVLSGMVNAYLITAGEGFVLVDTGMAAQRARLESALRDAGCLPGDLRLIVVTHGDPDHSGNAAYLRTAYGVKVAMHRLEAEAVERGDMFRSRSRMPFGRRLLKPLMTLFRLKKRDRFTPDLMLEDGDRLDEFGLDATILHVPGHSMGSIAVLMADGVLFSGDFLENRTRPSVATLVDDAEVLKAGFERVKALNVRTVYPGHGKPFPLDILC